MGWFWDNKSSDQNTNGDAYSKLDPALRDFLDKESPLKHEDTQQPRPRPRQQRPDPDAAPNTYRSQLGLDIPGATHESSPSIPPQDKPAVPPESLFQDGRYAHLWKTYRPKAEIDAASQSDQDKLANVVEAYKDRKAAIGRAAVENCVMEQMAERDCYASGDMKRLMTMCRTENRAFNRCYTMQSRFLKALGYLSSQSRTEEEEERIQMHADKLYHEMLERERQIEEAKKAGQEPPVFTPLIQNSSTTTALGGEQSAWARARQKAADAQLPTNFSEFPAKKQEEIRKRIEGLTGQQRELELQLIAAEERATHEYVEKVQETLEEERMHRAARRERGKETVGDQIKRMWGWG